MKTVRTQKDLLIILLIIFICILTWSAIHPRRVLTWFLEVFPALTGVIILIVTYKRFQFTTLVYVLILLHSIILMIGGHYTYARMPLFNYLRDILELSRNHYDRVGHFFQGFVPAIITREVLLRTSPLKKGKWLFFIIVCICLSISAMYEMIEWQYAVIKGGASAEEFLGSQGDIWDTQNDMAMALVGSLIALVTLSKYHDRLLKPFMKNRLISGSDFNPGEK